MSAADNTRSFSAPIGLDSFPWLQNDAGPGTPVSRAQALQVPAVYRGRNLIAGTISTLPICVTDADLNPVVSPLLRQIDPNVPNSVTISQTVEDLIFDAKSFWRVTARGSDGFPTYAEHVDFRFVSEQTPSQYMNILPSGFVEGSGIWINGVFTPNADVIRFDSPNPALCVYAARTIRRALQLELSATNYATTPQARDYFTPKDDADPADDDVTGLITDWSTGRRTNTTGYVPAGFDLNTIQSPNPVELQLAQLIDKVTRDIANTLGLDPEELGLSTTSRTYKNAVDRRQDRINECFGPYAVAIAQRLSMGDVTKRGQMVSFDWDNFLKANPTDRMTIQTGYLAAKVITVDEVRADEGLPALTPQQHMEIAESTPAPIEPSYANRNGDQVDSSNQLSASTPADSSPRFTSGYAGDVIVFEDVDLAETFSVNTNKRTITGLVVPWGAVGRPRGGGRFRFMKDSLKFDRAKIDRIKLLVDHDNSVGVGTCIKTWSDDTGQWATFKVSRTAAGDTALAMAADGSRDGLSVGIAHESDLAQFSHSPDPADVTVELVTSAPWKETSLVTLPAFEDARATAVAFTANSEGIAMPETEQATAPVAAPSAAETQSIAEIVQVAVQNGIAAGFAAAERPAVINATRETATTFVNEQPLYRFDGGTAQRCFTSDISKAANGDAEAAESLKRFADTEMVALFANITPANVATLNPVPTRPELYVPNLVFNTPLRSLVSTGALDNLIAFIVPKFSSSSGLVGDHTTGTEPTDGTYVTTSMTITPKGVSGRVDIDREVIDSGGSPQADQIIYGDMVREYTNSLEKRIVAALVALSLTDTPVVGTDGDLSQALIDLLAGFQFLRGGDTFDSLALDSTLYKAIAKAKDDTGRPLFPMLGAVNASGTTARSLKSIQVAEKLGIPAWALETANSGPQKSYIFNPASVWQWASAPRRIDMQFVNVSSVGIGIWGYSAEAVTRSTDVYQLAYSAS